MHPQNTPYYLILTNEWKPGEQSDIDILATAAAPDILWKLRHEQYPPIKTAKEFYAVVQASYIRQRAKGFAL